MEVDDIVTKRQRSRVPLHRFPGKGHRAIGESKSDYEIVGEVAKKLGMYEEFTEGKTVEDLRKVGL